MNVYGKKKGENKGVYVVEWLIEEVRVSESDRVIENYTN